MHDQSSTKGTTEAYVTSDDKIIPEIPQQKQDENQKEKQAEDLLTVQKV